MPPVLIAEIEAWVNGERYEPLRGHPASGRARAEGEGNGNGKGAENGVRESKQTNQDIRGVGHDDPRRFEQGGWLPRTRGECDRLRPSLERDAYVWYCSRSGPQQGGTARVL